MKRIYFAFFVIAVIKISFALGEIKTKIYMNILTPKESETVSDSFLISAKIEEEGRPFTETGGINWVSAVIKDSYGIDSMRVRLRDNGRGEDIRPNDGIWTSFTKIRLPEGTYSVSLMVKRDKDVFSSETRNFKVKFESLSEEIKLKEKEDLKEFILALNTGLKKLGGHLSEIDSSFKKEISDLRSKIYRLSIGISFGILSLIVIGAVLYVIPKKISKIKKPEERWRPVFSSLENMEKEISEIKKDLSGNYRILDSYKENFVKAVREIFSIYENIKELKEIPKENINALKITLRETLESLGVKEWEPEIGKPVPEGCEQSPAIEETPYPEGTILKVLSKGYIIPNIAIIKKPRVLVAGSKKINNEVKK